RHWTTLSAYLACSAGLSVVICYWLGPVTSQRTFRLLEIALRALALLCMLASCQFWQVSGVAAVAILLRGFLTSAVSAVAKVSMLRLRWALWQRLESAFWRCCPRWLRPLHRRRWLTEEDFSRQGRECTEVALEHLRRHCASPDCDAWRVSARLRDPAGFAQFVQ
uniref:Zf-RVT domain-containing protein n=2 Tax=Macrostomum lignano TaxID=282301 RepID=A0A1I8HQ44_9PLAT